MWGLLNDDRKYWKLIFLLCIEVQECFTYLHTGCSKTKFLAMRSTTAPYQPVGTVILKMWFCHGLNPGMFYKINFVVMDEISKPEGKERANLPVFVWQNRLTLGLIWISFFLFFNRNHKKKSFKISYLHLWMLIKLYMCLSRFR